MRDDIVIGRTRGRLSILLLVGLLLLAGCARHEPVVLKGSTMGTTYSIKIVDQVRDRQQLQATIDAELQRINRLMSTYDDASVLSRFNRAAVGAAQPVAEDIVSVLKLSREISANTGGAFDVTVGPLVNLWGFGPDGAPDRVPDDAAIQAAKSSMGTDTWSLEGNRLSKHADIYIDLSAIAKGYAVDRIALLLEKAGLRDYLVEIGGELKAAGRNPAGQHWRIAIEKPEALARSVYTAMPLKGLAMATSGDYRNYFEVDGERYSHIIDPRTGRPVTHRLASTTVLAPDAATADGYATAISILGPEAGLQLAEAQGLLVMVIIKTGDGFSEQMSSALERYLAATPIENSAS